MENTVTLLDYYGGDMRICLSAWQSTNIDFKTGVNDMPCDAGVYVILCVSNQKIYIGSSQNIKHRIKTHLSSLLARNHINKHMQNAFNAYGSDSFAFGVVEKTDPLNRVEREQYWMDLTRCYDREIGFNNTLKADSPSGYKHPVEIRRKMSKIKKGQIANGKAPRNNFGSKRPKEWSQERRQKLSEMRKGSNNPMYGKKEDEHHKKTRMQKMLSVPRWNAGLTKETDPRIAKLGAHNKGKIPHNAISCKLIDNETGEQWEGKTLKALAEKSPLSIATIGRIKRGVAGVATIQKYSFVEANYGE